MSLDGVEVVLVDMFVIDVNLVATRLTQHVTGWCIGGPCGYVCDRRGSRRYTSATACHWMVYRWSLWICL